MTGCLNDIGKHANLLEESEISRNVKAGAVLDRERERERERGRGGGETRACNVNIGAAFRCCCGP